MTLQTSSLLLGPRAQTFQSRFARGELEATLFPVTSQFVFGGFVQWQAGHQDPSPSHNCDAAWASGASLSHILSLVPGWGPEHSAGHSQLPRAQSQDQSSLC